MRRWVRERASAVVAQAQEIRTALLRHADPTPAEAETARVRLAVCNACEHRVPRALGDTCGLCGCFVSRKVYVAAATGCPAGK